jgi:hypothetical protein
MTPSVTLRSREDFLAITPYQLGFHPVDSIVVLGFTSRKLKVLARCDAAAPTRTAVRSLCLALKRSRGIALIAVHGYGPEWVVTPTITVAGDLETRGYPIADILRVSGQRYFCLRCPCTPDTGEPFDISTTAVAATATFAGMIVRPDREAVEKLVKPIGGIAALSMVQAVDRAEQRLDGLRDSDELVAEGRLAVDHAFAVAEAGRRLDEADAAWLSILITDIVVRDHAWARTDGERWHLELWLDLTRRAEPILAAPFATLLGWSAWRQGDGVLAVAALERAYRIDPTYQLAQVLLAALLDGQPPTVVKQWPLPPIPVACREEGDISECDGDRDSSRDLGR